MPITVTLLKCSKSLTTRYITNNTYSFALFVTLGSPPSTVSRFITISDTDTDPHCRDSTVCPINYLRKERVLILNIPTDHHELQDLDKYR